MPPPTIWIEEDNGLRIPIEQATLNLLPDNSKIITLIIKNGQDYPFEFENIVVKSADSEILNVNDGPHEIPPHDEISVKFNITMDLSDAGIQQLPPPEAFIELKAGLVPFEKAKLRLLSGTKTVINVIIRNNQDYDYSFGDITMTDKAATILDLDTIPHTIPAHWETSFRVLIELHINRFAKKLDLILSTSGGGYKIAGPALTLEVVDAGYLVPVVS